MRLLLEPERTNGLISCNLIGIDRSRIHLSAKQWVKPGTGAVLKFERIKVAGEVGYCDRKDDEYRTCFIVSNSRRAPRIPIDEFGSITVLGDEHAAAAECRLKDVSRFGLSVDARMMVKLGSMVCVQTDSILVVGEVRNQSSNFDGTYRTGVEINDIVSDDVALRRHRTLRHRVAEFVLGRPIGLM
jgi:hypothetical protein